MNQTSPQTKWDLLLAEYEHRFTEVLFHSARYHRQADYVHSVFTAVVAALTLFVTKTGVPATSLEGGRGWLYLIVLVAGLAFELHLITAIMDALSMVYLNGARLGAIERLLNSAVGEDVLTWDSSIVPFFFSTKTTGSGGWIKPQYLAAIWAIVLFGATVGVLGILCQLLLPSIVPYYSLGAVLLVAFYCHQWWLLQGEGLSFTKRHVYRLSHSATAREEEGTLVLAHSSEGVGVGKWIGFVTFLAGFGMLAMLSLRDGTFWLSSKVTFPLLAIPTVVVGDALLLPYINASGAKWLRSDDASHPHLRSRPTAFIVGTVFFACALINGLIHLRWVQDPYTGFTDRQAGALSDAGWWHLGFSTIESTYLVVLLLCWAHAAWMADDRANRSALRLWIAIGAFASLSLADFAVRHLVILKTLTLTRAVIEDGWSLLPFPLVTLLIVVLTITWRIRRRRAEVRLKA